MYSPSQLRNIEDDISFLTYNICSWDGNLLIPDFPRDQIQPETLLEEDTSSSCQQNNWGILLHNLYSQNLFSQNLQYFVYKFVCHTSYFVKT